MWQQLLAALAVVKAVSAQADAAGGAGPKKCTYVLALLGEIETEKIDEELIDPLGMKLAGGNSTATLCGEVNVKQEIIDGAEILVQLFKELDKELQYVGEVKGEICDNLSDNGTLWFPVTSAMGIDQCPIPGIVFKIPELVITLGQFDEFLCAAYVGKYRGTFTVIQAEKPMVIVVFYFGIFEDKCED